jgi:hypothetical protein
MACITGISFRFCSCLCAAEIRSTDALVPRSAIAIRLLDMLSIMEEF